MFWVHANRHAGYVLKGAAVLSVVLFACLIVAALISSSAGAQIALVTLIVLFIAWAVGWTFQDYL